jgi:hypothetical protein
VRFQKNISFLKTQIFYFFKLHIYIFKKKTQSQIIILLQFGLKSHFLSMKSQCQTHLKYGYPMEHDQCGSSIMSTLLLKANIERQTGPC